MKYLDVDDKDIAMVGIVILGGLALFVIPEPTAIITGAITALGALASSRKSSNNKPSS